MNSRWLSLVNVSLVVFTGLVMAWQLRHWSESDPEVAFGVVAQSWVRSERLAKLPGIEDRDRENFDASGSARHLDLLLPKDARVFLTGMTGLTNYNRIGYFFYMTYYLFPREIGVNLDQPIRLTKDGFAGRAAGSDDEIFANGYQVKLDINPDEELACKTLPGLPLRQVANPNWFDSGSDRIIAFLLPLLTALAGTGLFRLLFPTLNGQLPLRERLAYGLGLGMMALAALTLGIKLCGFHGPGLILFVMAAAGIAELWCERRPFWTGITVGGRKLLHHPVALVIGVLGLVIFLVLFRLAGLQGLAEFDAVAGWMLKAKIIHLYTGNEMVQWFSNPRLAHAHLDYPVLVPSLHAATFDSIGHVNEFVTKFWPAWMLLLLLTSLSSLYRGPAGRFQIPLVALLGLLLLPATQKYVQMEGGTLPMVFFTVLGFVQCALWLEEKDPARLELGLTFLFGAAMAKFEGFIFLALAGSWMLLLPPARPAINRPARRWRWAAFCLLAALPFACLRVRIPALHYESGWAGYALHHPGTMLSNWPGIFMILFARLFVNPDLASWQAEDGNLHWTGRWEGLASLYNHSTLGLAWFCLFLTVVIWLAIPARRRSIAWLLAMLVGTTAAFSGVFACFVQVTSLARVIGYTADNVAGRYLLPVLLAWFATLLTLVFRSLPATTSTAATGRTLPNRAGK